MPSPRPEQAKPQDKPKEPVTVAKVVPLPPQPVDEPLTAPALELFELKKAEVALPLVVKVHQLLDQDLSRKALIAELHKAAAFRLEVPSGNGSKALDRLQAACKTQNIGLSFERVALDRFQKPILKTNYVVYLEDIPPEELTRCLRRMGVEDNKPDAKKQRHPMLDALVLTQMTKQDRDQLSDLLGIDPATMQGRGPLGTDLSKPVSDKTADQIAASLAGNGGTPRPAGGKAAGRPPDQTGLVLSYNPVRPSANSPDIKRWLDLRKPARPGTLQMLLVLRTM